MFDLYTYQHNQEARYTTFHWGDHNQPRGYLRSALTIGVVYT